MLHLIASNGFHSTMDSRKEIQFNRDKEEE